MRVPVRKIYRAFPELDRFDDQQCERFVMQATRVALTKRIARHSLSILAGIFTFVIVFVLSGLALALTTSSRVSREMGEVVAVICTIAIGGLPILAGLTVRDWWLRRAIAARLKHARCPECDYSLLGLPLQDDSVVCPECGCRLKLQAYGLTPDDLLSPDAAAPDAEQDAAAAMPQQSAS